MSAWVVSQGHIDAIINWWVNENMELMEYSSESDWNIYGKQRKLLIKDLRLEQSRQRLGEILLNENIISVDYRYPEQNPEGEIRDMIDELRNRDRPWREGKLSTLPGNTEDINDDLLDLANLGGFVHDAERNRGISIGQFINCIHCLQYQSSEHPEWEDSDAWWILNSMELKAMRHLLGMKLLKENIPGNAKRIYMRDPSNPGNADPFGGPGSASVWGMD